MLKFIKFKRETSPEILPKCGYQCVVNCEPGLSSEGERLIGEEDHSMCKYIRCSEVVTSTGGGSGVMATPGSTTLSRGRNTDRHNRSL